MAQSLIPKYSVTNNLALRVYNSPEWINFSSVLIDEGLLYDGMANPYFP